MREDTIKINVEAEGIDETTEKMEALVDVMDGFPPQVTIKNCRDCILNIYPSQTRFVDNMTRVEQDEKKTD